MILDTMTNTKT